jgi:hypothetical protein
VLNHAKQTWIKFVGKRSYGCIQRACPVKRRGQFEARYPRSPLQISSANSVQGDLEKKLHGAAVNLMRFERLSVDFMEDIQSLVYKFTKWKTKGVSIFKKSANREAISNNQRILSG